MSNIAVQQLASVMPYHIFGRLTSSGVVTVMPVTIVYPDGTAPDRLLIKSIARRLDITSSDGSKFQITPAGIDRTINPWLVVTKKGSLLLDLVQERFTDLLDEVYEGDKEYAILARVLFTGVVDFQNV